MTKQTDTERNKAISQLESAANERYLKFWEGQNYSSFDLSVKTISLAIAALRAQSEAERKIEKVREYCLKAISDIGHTRPYVAACEDILQILEGKT